MSFVDEIRIHAEAGPGGNGVVRWRKEKFVPKGGPAGGDGGRGGDFYVQAVRDLQVLARYKAKKEFFAQKGEDGGKKSLHGKKGEDFILELPIGSIITKLNEDETLPVDGQESWQLLEEGQKILLLKGGYGGYGNEHFKSSTNTTPEESNLGGEGEKGDFKIELEILADLGLIGLPNAGKSSLLNMLTNANAKVADYAFTTLDPNLGDLYGYVIADIPGLIEGASEGKGLGTKFLRHIKRTRVLAHLISFDNSNMLKAYKQIRKELETYDKKNNLAEDGLAQKEEIVILTKSDTVEDEKIIKKKVTEFKKIFASSSGRNEKVFILSLYDDVSLKTLQDALMKILEKKV